jgi:hypothetical protein
VIYLQKVKEEMPRVAFEESPRSDGVHLSVVIHDIATTAGLDNYTYGNEKNTMMEMGFIWEQVLERALKDRYAICNIGELCVDGIYMTPDKFDVENWVLHEYKCTWKSSKNDPIDNWRWMTQVKGYLRATQTRRCDMHVLYINGDYKGTGPEWYRYSLEFTDQEIEENWTMIVNHAKRRGWIWQ